MKIKPNIEVTTRFTGTLELTEPELRALDALAGYGSEPFLVAFYDKLGESYLRPHANGLRTLFDSIRQHVPAQMAQMDKLRAAIKSVPPL